MAFDKDYKFCRRYLHPLLVQRLSKSRVPWQEEGVRAEKPQGQGILPPARQSEDVSTYIMSNTYRCSHGSNLGLDKLIA